MDYTKFTPPSRAIVHGIMAPFRAYFDPRVYGLERIRPDKPAMFICNHTIFGLTDGFLLGAEAYERRGVFIHALVSDAHQTIPVWRDIVADLGMVTASRTACAELMQAGRNLMVFPGGTREVCKHKGEAYQLTWKNRVGFAHMAIEYGYDLQPVASLGGEEMYDILWDSDDIMASPVGAFLKLTGLADKYFKGGDSLPPIATGIGATPFPKPERLYIEIGERIDTTRFAGHEDDPEALFALRGEVEEAINGLLERLNEYRNFDGRPEESWRKWLKGL